MVAKIKQNYSNVQVDWRPFLLRPDMPAEGMPVPEYIRRKAAVLGSQLQERASALGMTIVFPEYTPNPRRALEATEYAREKGKLEEFHRLVFHKFYGEGQDIGSWAVLRQAAEEAGLDPDEMESDTGAGKYKQVLNVEFRQAHALGITGIPAYILNQRYLIVGAHPYEVFAEALLQLGISPLK